MVSIPGGKITLFGIPVVLMAAVAIGHFTNIWGLREVKRITVPAIQFVQRTLKIGQSAGSA